MAFLPARMVRLLVGGHVKHQAGVIETLHQEKAVHLEDFLDPTHSTRIGAPLPGGAQASELLVRLRGLQKALGTGSGGGKFLATNDPAKLLADAEAAGLPPQRRAADLRSRLQAVEAEAALLAPFSGVPVDLSLFSGLKSVRAYVGTARSDPGPALARLGEAHVAPAARGFAVAAFVPTASAAAAEKALAECGFQAVEAPAAQGTPAQRLAALTAEKATLHSGLAAAETEIAGLRSAWGPKLAALESFLDAEVQKTQAPLRFAHTESTFHVEGWVPADRVNRVKNALAARFGEAIYVAELGDAPRSEDAAHAQGAGHDGGHDDGHGEGHHAVGAQDEPPVHLTNKGPAKPYEFLLGLLGKPRYNEIDPTKLMLVFFPLFFGLMVGDLAVGLLIMGVGFWLKKNKVFGIGGPAVGRTLFMGGLMAALVGGVVFGEALGIHFVTPDPEDGEEKEISWEGILGLHIPEEGFLHKTGAAPEAAPPPHGEEEHEKGILAPHSDQHLSVNSWFNLGYYSKIHDIQALLVWSVLIGLVHLVLGFLLGIRNVHKAHGLKLAIQEKAAWLFLLGGLGLLVWGLMGPDRLLVGLGGAAAFAAVALLWMGAAHTLGVGFIAILEVPSLFGNLLSYTRLAAIGASKAGIALAVVALADLATGGHLNAVWWAIYILGMLAITLLAILSGGLQSLRLQFVEFFSKFYQGGGRAYVPFGRRAA